MMRSMYAGVSGLKTHQTRMDVIGNNIANVNTAGFKASRVTFKEMLSQTLSGAKAPQDNRGGMNPQQVGLGVSLGSIDTNHVQGNLQSTGLGTDLAIQGNGYFIVNNGTQNFYTRAGALTLDENGNLVNASNGYIMQGWLANNGIINTNSPLTGIRIPIGDTMAPQASTEAVFAGNLNAADRVDWTATIDIYDSQGQKHTLTLKFTHTGNDTDNDNGNDTVNDNEWNWTATIDGATLGGSNEVDSDEITGTIIFGGDGKVVEVTGNTFDIDFNNGTDQITGFRLDLSAVTQMAGDNTLDGLYADGYSMGSLESFSIDNAGVITGSYSNGLTKAIGQIAVANFSNAGGLTRVGDTLFAESQNSGIAQIGAAGTAGRGKISAGTLEMSNVDLAEQFTDMITTQRGFQANSRIISTTDEMLQDLVNLKR
ncbi:MAG TPA: flagellar hook protein FlgE [Halanaerobiales bacterium]|nr:flagellar hook protein FlgE [Halanaerobiales bacterium]